MNRFLPGHVKILRVARSLIAALLLATCVSASVPFSSPAAGPMCALACCAGRAPHPAGSCMGGSCRTGLLSGVKTTHSHHPLPQQESESLCGLTGTLGQARFSRMLPAVDAASADLSHVSNTTTQNGSNDASAAAAVIAKPCHPDCGGCTSGFTSPNRQRNAATLAHADRPRPPSISGFADFGPHHALILSSLCRQGAPRGPPPSFS
jgi:hypothetical protein